MARFINPVSQYSDGNGIPLPGSKLSFFEPGTTTPKDTFSDSGLTTANTNPVIADADGRIPDIFLSGTYKAVLKNSSDVTIWTRDPIGDTTEGQFEIWLNDNTYNVPDIVTGSDDAFYRSLTDGNQGNDPTTSTANWEQIEFERIFNVNVTYALGDRTIGSDGMLYFSLIAANLNNNPVTDATTTNWRAADQMRSVDAGGTVDVITATYIPAVGALKDDLILRVRAAGANTVTTPTFAPNGLTAKTIVKTGNQALIVGDIFGADHELLLVYNSTNDNWELLNPNAANVDLSNLSSVGDVKIAKAWVNFNGTGTVAIRSDFNVSSITDNAVGDYTVNFQNNMSDADYSAQVNREGVSSNSGAIPGSLAVGTVRVFTFSGGAAFDSSTVVVTIHGN